jgi:hypothetical protein
MQSFILGLYQPEMKEMEWFDITEKEARWHPVLEDKMLKKIFGPKRDEGISDWTQLCNL